MVKRCSSESEAVEYITRENTRELASAFEAIDPSLDVDTDFLQQCIDEGIGGVEAVEKYYGVHSFGLSQLKPLLGNVNEFHAEIANLTRPYIAISDDEYQNLMEGRADYYETPNGRVVTFGVASTARTDSRYALMPLKEDEAEKILRNHFMGVIEQVKNSSAIRDILSEDGEGWGVIDIIDLVESTLNIEISTDDTELCGELLDHFNWQQQVTA